MHYDNGAYVDSIIASFRIGHEPREIGVPANASHYIVEGGTDRSQITFYDRMSRRDLAEVPADWMGRKMKFQI